MYGNIDQCTCAYLVGACHKRFGQSSIKQGQWVNMESKIALLQLMLFRLTKLGSNSQQLLQLAFQSVTALLGSMNEGSHLLLVFADAIT